MEPHEYLIDDYMPLDVAVALMAQGFDMNAFEDHQPLFDPYFED
jgi:hypothetical protein